MNDVAHVAFRAELVKQQSTPDHGIRLVLDVGEDDKAAVLNALAAGWLDLYALAVVITPVQDGQK